MSVSWSSNGGGASLVASATSVTAHGEGISSHQGILRKALTCKLRWVSSRHETWSQTWNPTFSQEFSEFEYHQLVKTLTNHFEAVAPWLVRVDPIRWDSYADGLQFNWQFEQAVHNCPFNCEEYSNSMNFEPRHFTIELFTIQLQLTEA